jgi:predicted transposase YbfD/YdcC
MIKSSPKGLIGHFLVIKDPRKERTKKHKLIDIFVIAICGIISGFETWVDIEEWAILNEKWLKKYLELSNGIPSHDTLGRVFSMINPKIFKKQFLKWVQEIREITDGQVISIDGKTVRRSFDKEKGNKAIHLVNAWCNENQLFLAQEKVYEKSNEITAIPKLLDILDVNGCIITMDAMGYQREIAKKIIEKKADYVLAIKQNQKVFFEDITPYFEDVDIKQHTTKNYDWYQTIEKDHGRIEKRTYCSFSNITWLKNKHSWIGLNSITQVISERTIRNQTSKETRYFISSLPASAKKIGHAIRSHWGIENACHWVLDVTFNEDQSRVRIGHAAENLSLLRKTALNLLKQEKSLSKKSLRIKRLHASQDKNYLAKVMGI